jgi:dihydropteroate synthase
VPVSDRPLFFGAGNVVELMDADSPGINALLAGMAHELGASIIFTSEHSDKTKGSIAEMRRATEMMALLEGRPYPKDLGIDLLLIKEKRRRREPPLSYHTLPVGQSRYLTRSSTIRAGTSGSASKGTASYRRD